MDDIKKKINLVLLKFSVNKWDILKEFDVSNLDSLAARVRWDEILTAIFGSESYLACAVKKLYVDMLGREADPDGLRSHVFAYGSRGWRFCLQGLLSSDEYWGKSGGPDAGAVLSAMWRHLADSDDPLAVDDLAAGCAGGTLSRGEAVSVLLSRPQVAVRQSSRLWRQLTGGSGAVPESVLAAFANGGPEGAIRIICELPEFALFTARNQAALERAPSAGSEDVVASIGEGLRRVAPSLLNPYKDRPPHTYWKSGVAALGAQTDPVVGAPFSISRADPIATVGSCFAQHLSKALAAQGYHYLVTEHYQPHVGVADEGYGVYPARFGNIYTARHLLQLFERAYGLRAPGNDYWHGDEGRFIDPFRPRIQEAGFPSIESLLDDRERHYRAVRRMFEQCSVFIFTLGLTESWISPADGSVYPLAPGVVASRLPDDNPHFHNFSVAEVSSDLDRFLALFHEINPQANVILTVSPVPLIATYEDRHVLVSTIASKSILRAAVDEICRRDERVTYFPSYEIVTGPQTGAKYYREDLREVSEEGVSFVMSVFSGHFLFDTGEMPPSLVETAPVVELREEDFAKYAHFVKVVCDEEAIVR